MAKVNEENQSFMGGLEKLTGILTELTEKLDAHIETCNTNDEELTGLNTGKTEEEIRREDEIVAQIAVPLINTLDSISAVLNSATKKIMEMTVEQ